jgi:hypothetical protein
MSDEYIPSPTFSDRVKRRKSEENKADNMVETIPVKKPTINKGVKLPPFPDIIRSHHLPLVLKSKSGDSLQVYLVSYAKKDEDGYYMYDVEFDDMSTKNNIPRAALSIPSSTSYEMMRLQESQQSTPPRPRGRMRR